MGVCLGPEPMTSETGLLVAGLVVGLALGLGIARLTGWGRKGR